MEKECVPNNQLNIEKTLNSRERQKLRRAQDRQEEVERTSQSCDHEIQRVSQTVINPNQETAVAMIQRADSDNHSDVTESGETQLSHEDPLRQIEYLETQLKKKQEENEAFRVFHKKKCCQIIKAYEEQLLTKNNFITSLKKARAADFENEKEKSRKAVEKDKAMNTANACLKGKLMASEEMIKQLSQTNNEMMERFNMMSNQKIYEKTQSTSAPLQKEERDSLQSEVNKLQSSLDEEKSSNRRAQSKIQRLQHDKNSQESEIKMLQSVRSEERLVNINKAATLEEEKAALQTERDSLRLNVNTLKSLFHEKTLALQEAPSKKQGNDSIQAEKGKFTLQLTNPESALHEKNMALEEAQMALQTKKEENDSLQAERDKLIMEVRKLESTLHQNNMALEEAKCKVKSQKQENDSLQAERDNLILQVRNLESSLNEKEIELKNALSKGKTLEDEKDDLMSSVENLTTAFRTQLKDTEEAHSKMTELNQEITRQKAIAETSEQELKSARDTFQITVQQCDSKFAAVLTEKQNMEKKVQNLGQEIEHLKVVHRQELSALQSSEEEKQLALQREQQALSTALEAAQKNNDVLLTHNRELEETVRIKQEQIEAMEKKKKKKRWFRWCFGC